MLQINPEDCLVDEEIHIKISTLKSHQRITLRCETIEKNYVYDSYAYFIGDYNGEVDLSLSPSFGGSYKGIDKMGIFSSMLPAKQQKKGLQYVPCDPMTPCQFKLQVYDGFVKDDEFEKPNIKNSTPKKYPITEKLIKRRYCAENVTREEISHGKVRAVLFKPKGPGPFKGIIDIYGGGGGLMEMRAPLFASHGFAAMVVPYFRYKDLPKTIFDFSLDNIVGAVDLLSSYNYILPGIALVGICLGGTIVMRLASECKNVSSVVCINGGYLPPTPLKLNNISMPTEEDFQKHVFQKRLGTDKRGGVIERYCVEDTENIPEEVVIKVEKISAKVLIIIGENDLTFDSRLTGVRFKERMEHYGKSDLVTCISYPGVGHFIQPPYLPLTLVYYVSAFDSIFASGGEEIETSCACIHAWREILHFIQVNTGVVSVESKL